MKAHRTDLVSFAFGLFFLALAAWWLLAQLLNLALPPVGWFLAGALILIGVLGVVGALRSGRSGDRAEQPAPQPGSEQTVDVPVAPYDGPAPQAGQPGPEQTVDVPVAPYDGPQAPPEERSLWGDQRPSWPEPGAVADERPTRAVTDESAEAVQDRPVVGPGDGTGERRG